MKPILNRILFWGVVAIMWIFSGCALPGGSPPAPIETSFVFEVQVLDAADKTTPAPGVVVYMKSYKFIEDGAKGLFEWSITTNQDGWAIAYPGYNVHDTDEIVFKADLVSYSFSEDVTAAHVVYGNVKPRANEENKAVYTVTLFLYK